MKTTVATRLVQRHSRLVRVTHWVNVALFAVLLASGLQIFNAHPFLYWGAQSEFHSPLAALEQGFPEWSTLPARVDLATGRRWHFMAAWAFVINGVLYLLWSCIGGHAARDLWPTRREWQGIAHTFREHLRWRFPHGEQARRYNVLQQLSYLVVVFLALPVMFLTGATMSPYLDAQFPFLVNVFGGRQSARTLHFIVAFSLLAFVFVHVVMVFATGFWNEMRSMITGNFAIRTQDKEPE